MSKLTRLWVDMDASPRWAENFRLRESLSSLLSIISAVDRDPVEGREDEWALKIAMLYALKGGGPNKFSSSMTLETKDGEIPLPVSISYRICFVFVLVNKDRGMYRLNMVEESDVKKMKNTRISIKAI